MQVHRPLSGHDRIGELTVRQRMRINPLPALSPAFFRSTLGG
jgi:hypothetical protein